MGAQRGATSRPSRGGKVSGCLGPGQAEDPGNRKIQGCHPAPSLPVPVASMWREGKGKSLLTLTLG